MKANHLSQAYGRTGVDPGAREIHHLHFVASQQDMRLAMGDRNHVFSIASYVIGFDIFACSLVEEVL